MIVCVCVLWARIQHSRGAPIENCTSNVFNATTTTPYDSSGSGGGGGGRRLVMTTTATATAATVPQSMAIIGGGVGGGGGGGSATANTADNTSATAGSKLFVYGGVDIRDEFEEVSSTVDPRERDRLPLQMRLKTANIAHGVYSLR